MKKRWLKRGVLALAGLLVLIQLVPYGHDHPNPPVVAEPAWSTPQVRALAVRACFDCHSNQTVWPWYSNVAPVSWLVLHDTVEGRSVLNFSEWNRPQKEAAEAGKTVREGEMPPSIYLLAHPEARLAAGERTQLIEGLNATLGGEGSAAREE